MSRTKTRLIVMVLSAGACGAAMAQNKPIPYPAKGQSAAQQQKDDGQCYAWAKSQTGIDPAAVAAQPPPPSGPAVGVASVSAGPRVGRSGAR